MLRYYFRLERIVSPLNQYAQLELMLALRALGYSYTELAEKFKCPRNTIEYLCQKFGLGGAKKPPIARSRTTSMKIHTPYYENEERINPGRTYAEYLQIEKERKWKRLTQNTIKR